MGRNSAPVSEVGASLARGFHLAVRRRAAPRETTDCRLLVMITRAARPLTAVAAVAYYERAYDLVRAHVEMRWTVRLVPLSVDG
jgi:hypothetical protein